jgi:hypothetical protein
MRRIVRILNDQHRGTMAGFYGSLIGGRFFRARSRHGVLEVFDFETWLPVAPDQIEFHDHNGRTIHLPEIPQ